MPRMKFVLTLIAAVMLSLPVTAQATAPPPEAATFRYTANLQPIGSSPQPPRASGVFNSDIAFWGNRMYHGNYDGFRIIDISNPASPVEILDYDQCRGNQGDVIIWENILVRSWNSANTSPTATCDGQAVPLGFEGLHIFDVSNPADPVLRSSVNVPGCGSHTATGVPDVANNRLIVYNNPSSSTPPTCAGFDIVQIPLSNPAAPSILGRFNPGRSCHDTAVILGDAMLGACAGGDGLTVFSIGGPNGGTLTAPRQLWTKSIPGVSIGHAASFSWDGSIVAFGHEPGGGGAAECEQNDDDVKMTTFFFNAQDGTELGRHVLARRQGSTENCTIHNFNVVPLQNRRIMVQGNYQAGIAILDFTNPANVREIAYADPAPLDQNNLILGGDWSTHWYDGEIYESDITRGLITWEFKDPSVAGARTLGHLNPQTQEFTIPFTGSLGSCKGNSVTHLGTGAGELLVGTSGADVFKAGGGHDRIVALGGNDVICAGGGKDKVSGSGGNDTLVGQGGNDNLRGGAGKDRLVGGPGKDRCHGGPQRDRSSRCEKELQL